MMIRLTLSSGIAALFLLAAGCSSAPEEKAPAPPRQVPVETPVLVSLDVSARSDEAQPGEIVIGRLADDILVDGEAVVAAGPPVALRVIEARAASETGPAMLTLELARMELPGGPAAVVTQPLEILGEPALVAEGTTAGEPVAGEVPADGEGPDSGAILGTMAGSAVMTRAEGGAVVLPAGQLLLFSTSSTFEVPRG